MIREADRRPLVQSPDHACGGDGRQREKIYIRHRVPNNIAAQGAGEKDLIGLVAGLPPQLPIKKY